MVTRKRTKRPVPKGRKPLYPTGNMILVGFRLPENVLEKAKSSAYDAHSTLGRWIRDTLIEHLRHIK